MGNEKTLAHTRWNCKTSGYAGGYLLSDIIMNIKLQKKIKPITFIMPALIAQFSHAETQSTTTMITTNIKSPTILSVNYIPKAILIANKSNKGKVIGILSVSGYAPTTTGATLRFSDNVGVSGRLTFSHTLDPDKHFQAKMYYKGFDSSPWINKGPGNMQGTLPEQVDFHIKVSSPDNIQAGNYSDIITITAINQ